MHLAYIRSIFVFCIISLQSLAFFFDAWKGIFQNFKYVMHWKKEVSCLYSRPRFLLLLSLYVYVCPRLLLLELQGGLGVLDCLKGSSSATGWGSVGWRSCSCPNLSANFKEICSVYTQLYQPLSVFSRSGLKPFNLVKIQAKASNLLGLFWSNAEN